MNARGSRVGSIAVGCSDERTNGDSEGRFALALQSARVIAAETDRELRYRWIANPHPDFDPSDVIGKRDDELGDSEGLLQLMNLRRRVLESQKTESQEIRFDGLDGTRIYDVIAEPLCDASGEVVGVSTAAVDVTERANAQQALCQNTRQKAAFLATLAHEIRNAAGAASLALSAARSNPTRLPRSLAIAERQLRQLERLAADLMDASRLARGELTLHRRRIDLTEVIQEVIESCATVIDEAGHKLTTVLPRGPVDLYADPDRLFQIFTNLVGNAVKYTPRGGHILLTVTCQASGVQVSVKDDGVGIPPDKLDLIFESFEQLDRKPEHGNGGLGVGLNLARSLVELHGGIIIALSDGEGEGSEFRVWFPISEG